MLNKANFEEMMGGNANRRRMRNGGKVPKGFHKMPDGSIMKNSKMKNMNKGGVSMNDAKKHLRRP
jgi:hypothetical protein|tara:strand:+ start:67 stop:261 length:195 start_codon:yes stop_codon:yes gene_type:complete